MAADREFSAIVWRIHLKYAAQYCIELITLLCEVFCLDDKEVVR